MPYWRLSAFYLFYFAALGALVPYWGLYLQSLGFDAAAIGELMAILMLSKVIAPNVWGWLADSLGRHMPIVRIASLVALLAFLGMFWVRGFWEIALVMTLFSFFWHAALPQFEAVTMLYLGSEVRRYARIRLWGSVGFILAVLLLGELIDRIGPQSIVPTVLGTFLGIWLASTRVTDPPQVGHTPGQGSIKGLLKHPGIIAFFLVVFLMQASHGPYYAFYSIYLDGHGYSKSAIGLLWTLGVLAEILVFLGMHRLLERFGGRIILVVSLWLAALRWGVTGLFPESLVIMSLVQLLHAATFGSFHAAAMHLVQAYFRGRHRGRGQALYGSLAFGAGGALGSLLSGYAWDSIGPTLTYVGAAATALAGVVVARYLVEEPRTSR
jgi:PPP family 3-phenylpropionic acid transporter